MIFTFSQIQDMLSILRRYEKYFIFNQLGASFLTAQDKALLLAAGIDVNKFTNKNGVIENAFLFGLLAEAIGDDRAKKMNYAQFKKFLAAGGFVPLTEAENFALQTVKMRAYTDITNLGARMRNSLQNSCLRNNQQQAAIVAQVIKKKAVNVIKNRQGARQLAAELSRVSKDWEVDWLRIAYYLTHEAYNSGRAQSILKNYGKNAEVWFDVYENACEKCAELYLEEPHEVGVSKPKVFKLDEIINNGNNIGRKKDDWLPTISPTHPYCRCTINYKKPNTEWSDETRSFSKLKKYVPKNKKLQGIKLNIKVSKG